MKFILFGGGDIGLTALKVLGSDNVECFADNYKVGSVISGKRVISFDEMIAMAHVYSLVITSNDYAEVLEAQLLSKGITEYIVFNRRNTKELIKNLPKYNYLYNTQYMNYTDILLNYEIHKYSKIAIYGMNEHIDYLLFEIAILRDIKNVVAIIDDEVERSNKNGIPILKLSEVEDKIDCLIVNKRRGESDIRERLEDNKYAIIDMFDVDKFIHYNQHPELAIFKDVHKGERAFIIGNGPSITFEDLETLHKFNEKCIALNKIHKIFDSTLWRPNYICMSDARVISACESEMDLITKNSIVFMADRFCYSDVGRLNNVQYVHLKSEYFLPNLPGFSVDITKGTNWGGSVTYDLALQIAVYMGFSEIYLLGIDHNNVGEVTNEKNHFIPNYFTKEEEEIYKGVVANFESMNLAYKKAELFSRTHGFRIYNATRGGKLETFERVNFDSLFN